LLFSLSCPISGVRKNGSQTKPMEEVTRKDALEVEEEENQTSPAQT